MNLLLLEFISTKNTLFPHLNSHQQILSLILLLFPQCSPSDVVRVNYTFLIINVI